MNELHLSITHSNSRSTIKAKLLRSMQWDGTFGSSRFECNPLVYFEYPSTAPQIIDRNNAVITDTITSSIYSSVYNRNAFDISIPSWEQTSQGITFIIDITLNYDVPSLLFIQTIMGYMISFHGLPILLNQRLSSSIQCDSDLFIWRVQSNSSNIFQLFYPVKWPPDEGSSLQYPHTISLTNTLLYNDIVHSPSFHEFSIQTVDGPLLHASINHNHPIIPSPNPFLFTKPPSITFRHIEVC